MALFEKSPYYKAVELVSKISNNIKVFYTLSELKK